MMSVKQKWKPMTIVIFQNENVFRCLFSIEFRAIRLASVKNLFLDDVFGPSQIFQN